MVTEYDEFSMFHENAEEYGIPYDGPPTVRREATLLDDGRALSSLVWGDGEPEYFFLHGGAQNAHTWDTVALALGRPLVCVDLPGHGHSGPGRDGSLDVHANARDLAVVLRTLAPKAKAVIGMSLGGMTSIALAHVAPELVRKLVLVDVTPTIDPDRSAHIGAFVNGPESFDSFDELLERTCAFNPTRSVASMRRGILHNAVQRDDGTWVWRYARFRADDAETDVSMAGLSPLWDIVSELEMPLLLARGMRDQSVVGDEDVAELLRRKPDALVVEFERSGHSIQGDEPVELAETIRDFAP
jgi:pimeloyl-ACP methyl ester carboxylesterase